MRKKVIDLDKFIEEDELDRYHGKVLNEFISILSDKYDAVMLVTSKKVKTGFSESIVAGNVASYETPSGKTTILIRFPNNFYDDEYMEEEV